MNRLGVLSTMSRLRIERKRLYLRLLRFGVLLLPLWGLAPKAHADITVLLEEPYSYDGALAGTGHTAVYLNRICAATPVVLRRCAPGERGVVISRYTRIAGYDWIAIPLIPYLYAVEKPEDVPLYADSKLAGFLRDQYRRSYLEDIAPDTPTGDTPKGDWYELVGSLYDRTDYGFQIETTEEQDDALIEWLNMRPNHASYKVVSRNCANFVRDIVNFYYPHAVSRGFITDLEVTTPKHDAKSLVKYTNGHPDILTSRIVFPQVPGTIRRSSPVRGVLESVFRAKKYMIPLAAIHPIIAGGVISMYLLGDRFNPARNGLVYNMNGDPAAPPTNDELQAYMKNLKAIVAASGRKDEGLEGISWRQFQQKAQLGLDEYGHPTLQAPIGDQVVEMGVTRDDVASDDFPAELRRGLLQARLRQQLTRSRAPKISTDELHQDWRLLQQINSTEKEEISRRTSNRIQKPEGNSD